MYDECMNLRPNGPRKYLAYLPLYHPRNPTSVLRHKGYIIDADVRCFGTKVAISQTNLDRPYFRKDAAFTRSQEAFL